MSALTLWLTRKRVCAWCRPAAGLANQPPSRFDLRGWMGGNPFSGNITHGICPACKANVLAAARENNAGK